MRPRLVIPRRRWQLAALIAVCLLLSCGGAKDLDDTSAPGAASPPSGEPPSSDDSAEGRTPTSEPGIRPRGLWVLAEGSQRVLEDPARLAPLVERAVLLGASDLFVQVYRGGRAWYDATLADPAPHAALIARGGVDTLAELITLAHAHGLRVHAWVNVLSLSTNRDAALLAELGREAVLVDRHGRSLLDYPDLEVPEPDARWYRMGTRGVYLDAAAPGVRERLVAIFSELVTRYPELDGLHLDYIRQPGALPFVPGSRFGVGLDFGYGEASRRRFQLETGLAGPYADPAHPDPTRLLNSNEWDDWRRDQVTALVAAIREATLAARPGLLLSAAVNSYVDRAYLSLCQDWQRWLEEGLIDLAVPMAYTLDDRLLRYQLEHFARSPHGERIWPGLGSWLFARQPERALAQIELARAAGSPGDALFSYDSIVESPGLLSALSRSPGQPAALAP